MKTYSTLYLLSSHIFWDTVPSKVKVNILYGTQTLYLQSTVIISGNGKVMEEALELSH